MSCPFLFVSRRPKGGTSQVQLQTDLYECLKNISDQIKKDGVYVPEVLRPLVRCVIVETVVGPSHIAFRLQDGRICRLSYSLRADKFVCVNERKRGRSSDSRSEFPYSRESNAGSVRVSNAPVALRTLRAPMSVLGRGSRSMSLFREMQRQGLYLRPLSSQISPADVPENLIEQCQMVLQGKSRQLIIRELQRTNLDVNMAVNNMLSREDEADFNSASGAVNIGDDWEDDAEDIFSLLDHPEGLLLEGEGDFQDDIIDRSSSPRFRREILMDCDRNLGDHATYTDRRKRRRFDTQGFLRNPETYGGRAAESRLLLRNMGLPDEKQEEEGSYETVSGSTKCVESNVQLGDRLEFWPTSSAESVGSHFVSIAALYTELVAINSRGELHQWKWQSPEPFNPHGVNSSPFNLMEQPETGTSPVNHRHPRATSLGITHEKVVSLSGCVTRASIMTASGAIATWMDEMLPSLFHSAAPASSAAATAATAALMRLEHPAIHFNELKAEVVIRVSTAPLITVVQCASGAVFWWGVLPSYIRQRNAEKQKHSSSASTAPTTTGTTANASRHRSTSGSSEVGSKTPVANTATTCAPPLSPGDLVCMRNAPMFHSGAIGFTLTNGIPKVGVLLEDAWKLTDVCRFRVKSPSALRGQTGVVVVGTGGGTIAGKSSSTEAIHALTCPYAQAAAAAAAAAAAQTDHEPPSADSGALEMPPPPSPASSTCSDHSGPVKVSPRTFKRKKAPSTSSDGSGNGGGASGSGARRGLDQLDQQQQQLPKQTSKPITSKPQYDEEIEDWCLSEVVFVEDGRTQPVGVLLKIDGTIAAVKFLKEQDRACLAARCPSAPVCLFINHITKTTPALQKPFVAPPAASSPSSASSLVSPHDPMAWLNDCRLLKKDDLMQVKQTVGGGLSQRVPDFVQPTPRHILMNFLTTKSNSLPTNISKKRIFALVPENSRLHAIVGRAEPETAIGSGEEQRMRHLEYHVFTLNGKTVSSRRLPALSKPTGGLDDAIEANGAKSSYSDIMLTCPAERPLLLRDNAGVVFPFLPPSRPGQESWVFPPWLDLPAVQCAALSWISASPPRAISATISTPTSQRDTEATTTTSTSRAGGENGKKLTLSSSAAAGDLQGDPRLLLGVVVVRETSLLQHILRADESKVEETLRLLNTAPLCQVESVASEMADGHRTILHVAVLMCAPMTRETPEMIDRLENILKRTGSGNIGSISVPPSQPPPPSSDGSGWTTISPSPPPPPPPPLPRSLHSLLNLSASSNQRSSNVGVASSAATASSSTSSVHDLFIRSPLEAAAASVVEAAAAVSVAAAPSSSTSSSGHFCHMAPLPATEEVSRRVASHRILRALILHPRLRTLLPRLLACLSDDGLTPFMLAIQCKAYQVAVFLLDFLAELEGIRSDGSEESAHQFRYTRLMRYLFPPSARLDDSPLFTLCYNDTCSFTWTGPNHIRQDIFECRTCGLMDSLCCCSECARVCHKGHDCRLKRTSPTAYCDCWEKCRCRSLVLGHQASRLSLFQRLLLHTDLVYLPNRANEHLLVYLTRCVERQTREQKQYKSARRRGGSSGGGGSGGGGGGSGSGGGERGALPGARAGASALDEPEHDLEPPTFSRDALELVLDSKAAAASLLCDCKNVVATESFSKFGDRKGKAGACQSVMAIQSGTSQLDDFVFTLLCKCPAEFVQRLVNTLARSLSDHLSSDRGVWRLLSLSLSSITSSGTEITDACFYCQRGIARFLRSVARVYTGLMLELSPDHHKKKPRLVTQAQPLELARFVFFQLAPVALPELASLAVKVVTPVRIGALRSTATFNLTSQQGEAIHGLDQVLSAERSSFSRSRQSQPSTCTSSINGFSGLGNALDCPNSVIRLLLYGCDSTDPDASTLLPTWEVNERQQPLASPPKTEQQQQQQQQRKPLQPSERGKSCASTDATLYNVEEPMDIDSTSQEPASGSSNHMKRRRHRSQSSGGGGDHQSPPSKHRRRHRHHSRRRRNRDTNDRPLQPPQPPAPLPPVIVVESSVATTNSTASTNPFAEMELLPAPSGDSDTDADVRSNELDSNATTAAAASTHTVEEEEEEEDFSDTASEEIAADSEVETHSITSSTGGGGGGGGGDGSGVERSLLLNQNPQIEASGSQHSSISSTAATAGTTGSVIMDMDASVAGGSLSTASGAVASASSQQEFIASYPPDRDQQPPPGGNSTMDDDTVVVTMFCGSDEEEEEEEGDENELDETLPISDMGIEEDLDHGTRRRNQREDDVSEVEEEDEDDEEEEEIEDDEEVGVEEEEEEEDDSEDDGGDSEDDEDDDVEEEEEEDDETEEEEEAAQERGVEGEEEEEEEEDAYSQESEPSPPPSSPFSPWSRHPGGSSNAPAPTASTEDAAPTTSTSAAATTAASRNFPTSSSTLARLYSAALSSAFDQRTGRNTSLASRNALASLNLLSAPLSPPRANSNNANNSSTTVTTSALNGVTPTVGSAPIVSITEPTSNSDASEAKKHGINVTQVQLSRAFACLLRLLADVMSDLVNRSNDVVDTEAGIGETEGSASTESRASNSDMRRCVSAPVFVHSSLDLPLLRKLRVFSRKGNGFCLAPLRSLVAARPTDSMDQALICTAVGFVLAPVWAWLTEALDGLESRLRARAAWNAHHPNASSVELSTLDSGSSRRKEGKSDRTGGGGRSGSQRQHSGAENATPNEAGSSSNAIGGAGTSAGTGHNVTPGAVTAGGGEVSTGGGGGGGRNSSNRQQLLSYLLSLMRTANNDHGVVIPPVDIYSYKHTAYLVDAFLYFFKVFECTWPSGLVHHLIHLHDSNANANEGMEVEGKEVEELGSAAPVTAEGLTGGPGGTNNAVGLFQGHPLAQRSDAFFRRSASTLSLVGVGLDPVLAPASEAMPLAFTPQQLHPNSRRSELFGTARDFDSDFLSSFPYSVDKVGCPDNEADVKVLHYSRIGRSFKDSKMGTQITWGGEFLDTVCHTGSVLTRWCRSLEAFSQAFAEDVGSEHRSYMLELARFPDKEARFRKEMERLRNATRRDLTLEVEREPNALIISTVRQLNTEFSRRLSQTSTITQMLIMRDSLSSRYSDLLHLSDATSSQQPSPNLSASTSPILSCRRLKVTFKDEPGEGSGVARSFITAFSEAVLANVALPDLSPLFASVSGVPSAPSASDPFQPRSSSLLMAATSRLLTRLRLPYGSHVTSAQQPPSTTSANTASVITPVVSTRLRRGDLQAVGPASRALFRNPVTSSISINLSSSSASATATSAPNPSVEREDEERERMEDRSIGPQLASSPSTLGGKTSGEVPTTTADTVGSGSSSSETAGRAPLFWQPGITGFYSPRGVGSNLPSDSPELLCRLSLYRCVGRVIGLCLLFNETCPMRFNRHVLKYLLGRPLCWHDFAFYNTTVYEGLRQLLLYTTSERTEGAPDSIRDYSLTFSLIMAPEEGGGAGGDGIGDGTGGSSAPQQHLLVPGGDEIEVDSEKIYEFVKRYTEFKMVEAVKEPLEQMRLGVFDALPANSLDGLTAEDLRLLLNGIWDVDVDLLASYTTFLDESNCGAAAAAAEGGVQSEGATETSTTVSAANERVARLKRWFWHVVKSLDARQRQDLLYFWTSSPALPASAQGFAPMPTIMIRPADDQHLPTANTCISRLYLPLYSSKHILREKLLQAIETRSFGFV